MPSTLRSYLRRSSLLCFLAAAACATAFDPDNDDQVVGSETYATPFAVTDKGAVLVREHRGQMGEHASGVYRAWRVETSRGEVLSPWLTTTPLVDGRGQPLLRMSAAGEVFAFDPGAAIDSRDQQTHRPRGWYRVGSGGLTGAPFDEVVLRADGSYETLRAEGDHLNLRAHHPDGALAGELAIRKDSARAAGRSGLRLVQRATDGLAVLVDGALRECGRIVDRATAPGEWFDLAAAAPAAECQGMVFGLGDARQLVTADGDSLAGPWQSIVPLVDRTLAALLLIDPNGSLTLVEPTANGLRVLVREATFAIPQSRQVPPEFADVGWGEQASVLLVGVKTPQGDGYALFARIEGLLRGPYTAATSEATTAAMWQALQPIATERRVANENARAAAAAVVAAQAAQLQGAVDQNLAKLAAIDREQIAYFEALKVADLAAAGRAIATMEQQRSGFFVPQGHAQTEAMQRQYADGNLYLLDWELRRPDRSVPRLAAHAASFFYQGGGIYERFCREAGRLLLVHENVLAREECDVLVRNSYGFSKEGREALAWQRDRMERKEAEVRYRALLAAGRFDDAHGMAYQLGFEGWVEHLQTQAKGRVSDAELEALLRAALERAPTAEWKAKLQGAHQSQWQDMMAAAEREQRARFQRIDAEMRRAQAAADIAQRERWAAYKLEAQQRGFLWSGND